MKQKQVRQPSTPKREKPVRCKWPGIKYMIVHGERTSTPGDPVKERQIRALVKKMGKCGVHGSSAAEV